MGGGKGFELNLVGRKIQEKSVNGVGEKSEIDEKTVTAAVEEDAEGIGILPRP